MSRSEQSGICSDLRFRLNRIGATEIEFKSELDGSAEPPMFIGPTVFIFKSIYSRIFVFVWCGVLKLNTYIEMFVMIMYGWHDFNEDPRQ